MKRSKSLVAHNKAYKSKKNSRPGLSDSEFGFEDKCHSRPKSADKRSSINNADLENLDKNELTSNNKIKQFYEKLLNSKEVELNALRISHQRRLERLLSLEKEHGLLQQHIEILEKSETKHGKEETRLHSTPKISSLVGYKRKDNETLWNEMKFIRNENTSLKSENLGLKECCDLLKVKLSEQLEEIDTLKFELNVNVNQKKAQYGAKQESLEVEIKKIQEKNSALIQELNDLKNKLSQTELKCSSLITDRIKYVNLSSQLTLENKKLYKKWFQLRKSTNKLVLNEKLRKNKQQQQCELNVRRKSLNEKLNKQNEKSLLIKLKQAIEDSKEYKLKYDELSKVKHDIDAKMTELHEENVKLKKDLSQMEQKIKSLRSQNENLIDEMKKKECERKEKEKTYQKQEEQVRDDLKKSKIICCI